MCGRYLFEPEKSPEIARIYDLADQAGFAPKVGEVFPGDQTAVIVAGARQVQVVAMEWGFPGFSQGQRLINARAETVQDKRMFAQSFAAMRCVYPTTGFFEWTKQKEKVWFNYQTKAQPLYLAGFYGQFSGQDRSIILTTQPNQAVAAVHDRMPLLLEKKQINRWIYDHDFARQFLTAAMPDLVGQRWVEN
ncbi:hypothetical protein LFYK43_02460 [Ligilactobacillus salitolerans]|uniref:Abasic site processing protein n=1 Tax=Ligilactobacillus salitolerans TaxID=1808352 RepID=A0A401IQH3_9LACO|nr:SOS response-associated peptidase family protein [Ligilactobacillus salitolerans]GBG93787.1 hypothetical protein LFYK43_02460 [Ligilactobacillus salitolerans]